LAGGRAAGRRLNCSIPVGLAGAGRAFPFSSVRERVRAVAQRDDTRFRGDLDPSAH